MVIALTDTSDLIFNRFRVLLLLLISAVKLSLHTRCIWRPFGQMRAILVCGHATATQYQWFAQKRQHTNARTPVLCGWRMLLLQQPHACRRGVWLAKLDKQAVSRVKELPPAAPSSLISYLTAHLRASHIALSIPNIPSISPHQTKAALCHARFLRVCCV